MLLKGAESGGRAALGSGIWCHRDAQLPFKPCQWTAAFHFHFIPSPPSLPSRQYKKKDKIEFHHQTVAGRICPSDKGCILTVDCSGSAGSRQVVRGRVLMAQCHWPPSLILRLFIYECTWAIVSKKKKKKKKKRGGGGCKPLNSTKTLTHKTLNLVA